MKYSASITLLPSGGRESPITHSPFMCYMVLPENNNTAYSCSIATDKLPWSLGETREVEVKFGWETLPFEFKNTPVILKEISSIGNGVLFCG